MTAATSSSLPFRWYFSVAAALLIFVVVGVYSLRMANDTTGYDEEQAKERYEKLATLQAQDAKTIGTADWIDKDKGLVRIPVDEAMAQEVPVLAAKPVTMGAVIPGAVAPANLPATNAAPASAAPSGTTPGAPTADAKAPSETGKPPAAPNAPTSQKQAPTGHAPPNPQPTK